uniref:Reverse transcriptase domain-containing protein n=1 Tax=Strongyloides venezuelensis TaxID=75913 RepID=A0A0K0FAW0_STRVS
MTGVHIIISNEEFLNRLQSRILFPLSDVISQNKFDLGNFIEEVPRVRMINNWMEKRNYISYRTPDRMKPLINELLSKMFQLGVIEVEEFAHMPIGYINSTSILHFLLTKHMNCKSVQFYVDDAKISSTIVSVQLVKFTEIFLEFKRMNLKICIGKSIFCAKKINLLGLTLSKGILDIPQSAKDIILRINLPKDISSF